MIHELSKTSSIFSTFIAEIRDKEIQKDPLRFRRNLERISEVLGYEVSKKLEYQLKEVETPLGIANVELLKEQPVLATILRAGLGMHLGLLNYFDRAESAFEFKEIEFTDDATQGVNWLENASFIPAIFTSSKSSTFKAVFPSPPNAFWPFSTITSDVVVDVGDVIFKVALVTVPVIPLVSKYI